MVMGDKARGIAIVKADALYDLMEGQTNVWNAKSWRNK